MQLPSPRTPDMAPARNPNLFRSVLPPCDGSVQLPLPWTLLDLRQLGNPYHLPDRAQSSQRLSLSVSLTIQDNEVSLPLHSESIRKAVTKLGPGLSSYVLSGTPIPQTLWLSLSLSCKISQPLIQTNNFKKESRNEKVKVVLLEYGKNQDTTMEKGPFSIFLFSLK